MNRLLVGYLLGAILLVEAAAMAPALLIALFYGDGDAMALAKSILVLLVVGLPLRFGCQPRERNFRAREGFLVVALSWVALSAFGALPFVFSGELPNYEDAFFEAVSGFTTTGATVTTHFEGAPHGIMFWRSFTHWIGGMGVLVLTLALLPKMGGRTSHLVRAESPGPTLSKIVPKIGDMAKILYIIYLALTMVEFALLMVAGMGPFDAAIHAMGTAGTGGFSNYVSSVGYFQSGWIDLIITAFMLIFGTNFALYYRLLTGGWRDALRSEELRWYLGIFLVATGMITVMILPQYGSWVQALRYAGFQVSSVMSTTGFATADFTLWPAFSKSRLILVMLIGASAGSTGGGLKVSRIIIFFKSSAQEIGKMLNPRRTSSVRINGHSLPAATIRNTLVFISLYFLLTFVFTAIVSLDGYDFETTFASVVSCMSNVGPGLGPAGPMGSYDIFSDLSKVIMSFAMLAGRLEIFPMLILFAPATWRRH